MDMILFEDRMQEVVDLMQPIQINKDLSRNPVFYWGTGNDLPQFLKDKKDGHFPLVWSVTSEDDHLDDWYERDCEIVFATRETRKELLNTERIKDFYSFKTVLIPMMEDFKRRSLGVFEFSDVKTTLIPNYSAQNANKNATPEIWDVLRFRAKVIYNENYNC